MLTLAIVVAFLCGGALLIWALARRRRPGPGADGTPGETTEGRLASIRKAGL